MKARHTFKCVLRIKSMLNNSARADVIFDEHLVLVISYVQVLWPCLMLCGIRIGEEVRIQTFKGWTGIRGVPTLSTFNDVCQHLISDRQEYMHTASIQMVNWPNFSRR